MKSELEHTINAEEVITVTGKRIFRIVCRGSWLSLAQAEIFKKKVTEKYPFIKMEVVIKDTAGDKNQTTPLHLIDGKDFFTKEIQEYLETGDADFAVHSMKDVSGELYFKENYYAVIGRNDLRDVAIFNSNVIEKLKTGEKIVIGTSSPRRSEMASSFLKNALPQFLKRKPQIETIPIRGNVDSRLKKLVKTGQFDGIILAAAGLNRLLEFELSCFDIQKLLLNTKIMYLPLFECPPAAGQGAIVVETTKSNYGAIEILMTIKDKQVHKDIFLERKIADKYGFGCSQQFGTFQLHTDSISFGYTSGLNKEMISFSEWDFTASSSMLTEPLFSATDYMKEFFDYEFINDQQIDKNVKAIFVSSHKAIHSVDLVNQVSLKKVWVAGSKTWMELAKKGIWIEGSADGLGFEYITNILNTPLVKLLPDDIQILTNSASAIQWMKEGYLAMPTYLLIPALSAELSLTISNAQTIFWTSFQQYQLCKKLIKPSAIHICLPGKTAQQLQEEGIQPIIFPSIKAFNEWRIKHTPVTVEE